MESLRNNFLILGQGFAGTSLAWHLYEKKVNFLILDKEEEGASRISAGLIQPLTGKDFYPSWEIEKIYPYSLKFYHRCEKILGKQFLFPLKTLKIFLEKGKKEKWDSRKREESFSRWVLREKIWKHKGKSFPATEFFGLRLSSRHFLNASKEFFKSKGFYQKHSFQEEDISVSKEKILWQGKEFTSCIDCRGISSLLSDWFSFIPHRSSKGTLFQIHIPSLKEKCCLNWGNWLLPEKEESLYQLGATYTDLRNLSEEKEREEALLENFKRMELSPFSLLSQKSGIRPIIRRSQPLIGIHPQIPQLFFFNGLGSKGASTSPFVSSFLSETLCTQKPFPENLSLQIWLKKNA